MTHLDDAVLVALRDGEPIGDDEQRHWNECIACREALRGATERARVIDDLLSGIAIDVDTEAAKAAVRARIDGERSREKRPPWGYRSLRRAAAILLLTAGAAYALPGSPVPAWLGLEGPWRAASPPEGSVQEPPGGGGVEVDVGERLDVVLNGVPPGTGVEVLWHEGGSARIGAGAGSTYVVGAGRAEATVAAGPVVLELPRSAPMLTITINGRMVFEGTVDASTVTDVQSRSEDRVVFVAPGG